MVQFLLKRIALFIPTLLLVALTAFILSKLVPGDPAESMLALQGITPDNPRSGQEYARHYTTLHLNKPLFYCSLKPDFYPKNINALTDRDQRHLVQTLLKQKITYPAIQKYLDARTAFLSQTTTNPEEQALWSDWIHPVRFENDIRQLSTLSKKKLLSQSALHTTAESLISAIQYMHSSQKDFYYPVLYWHGTDNQFHHWLSKILTGDFGISSKDGQAVLPKISTALYRTLLLTLISLLVSVLISVPLGLWSGMKRGSLFDRVNQVVWLIFYAIPVFWLASMLIIYFTSDRFGSWFHIFPAPGLWYIPEGQHVLTTFFQYSHQLILPVICLVANDIAPLSTLVRNNVIAQKSKGYVLMAYAKGLSTKQTLLRHIFPNVMLPLITIIGGRLISGISGALIVEVIFNIPGMGRLMYDSIYAADWNVVFGILILLAIVAIIVLTISDILYAWTDPRIRDKIRKS